MKQRDRSLLDEIEADVLAERPRVSVALRKCIALGSRAGSVELRDWASTELKGYEPGDKLPEYRQLGAAIHIDATSGYTQIKGQMIGYHALPAEVREVVQEDVQLYMGVGELQAMADSNDDTHIRIGLPQAPMIAAMMNAANDTPFQHIERVYWSLARSRLQGVLEQIAARVVELIAEIRAGLPDDDDLPSAELTDRALSIAVHGGEARISVQATNTSADTGPVTVTSDLGDVTDDAGWSTWSLTRKAVSVVLGLATLAGAVLGVIALL